MGQRRINRIAGYPRGGGGGGDGGDGVCVYVYVCVLGVYVSIRAGECEGVLVCVTTFFVWCGVAFGMHVR